MPAFEDEDIGKMKELMSDEAREEFLAKANEILQQNEGKKNEKR